MKKLKLTALLLIIVFAVSLSGCLNGNDVSDDGNTSSDRPGNISGNFSSGSQPAPAFDANLTLIDSVPPDFSFYATTTVKSHGQHIGITDALFGYRGIYHYGSNQTPVFLTFYETAIANTSKTPADYIDMMAQNHEKQYGSNSNIQTVSFSGHDAVLFEATTSEVPPYGRYMIAWSLGDSLLVTVTGNVDASVLMELATASGD